MKCILRKMKEWLKKFNVNHSRTGTLTTKFFFLKLIENKGFVAQNYEEWIFTKFAQSYNQEGRG